MTFFRKINHFLQTQLFLLRLLYLFCSIFKVLSKLFSCRFNSSFSRRSLASSWLPLLDCPNCPNPLLFFFWSHIFIVAFLLTLLSVWSPRTDCYKLLWTCGFYCIPPIMGDVKYKGKSFEIFSSICLVFKWGIELLLVKHKAYETVLYIYMGNRN